MPRHHVPLAALLLVTVVALVRGPTLSVQLHVVLQPVAAAQAA